MTGINLQRQRSFARIPGTWKFMQKGSIAIAWQEGRFTKLIRSQERVVITMQRPTDAEPICSLEWRFAPATILINRRWSGEFCVYVARQHDLVITSHLKLAVLECGKMPKNVRPVSPGSSLHIRGRKWEKHQLPMRPSQFFRTERVILKRFVRFAV